jgi:hypothetical protein
VIELSLPRAPRGREAVELQVTAPPFPPGSRVVVRTDRGDVLGAVTSSDVPAVGAGSTATVPVPRTALVDGRLRLRLDVLVRGEPPRAPFEGEIRLNLVLSPTE